MSDFYGTCPACSKAVVIQVETAIGGQILYGPDITVVHQCRVPVPGVKLTWSECMSLENRRQVETWMRLQGIEPSNPMSDPDEDDDQERLEGLMAE